MKKNVGTVDRFIRIIMAAVIAILLYSNSVTGTVGLVLLTISAVLLLTSLFGVCPLYSVVGVNTCSEEGRML